MSALTVTRRIAALGAIASLAACGGGGGSHAIPTASAPTGGLTNPSSASMVQTLVAPAKFSTAVKGAPATSVDGLVVHVVVNLRNAQALQDYARGVSDANDGRYRQFLTASQIGDQFGASASDYQAVADYFASYGLRVGGYPQRLALTVAGPRTAFEQALGTTFSFYTTTEGHQIVAPASTAIHFAKPLPVTSVAGIISDPQAMHLQYVPGLGGPTQSSIGGATPQQIAAAFDYNGAYNAGFTGNGINVGVIGTGPIVPADFTVFKNTFNWTGKANLTVRVGTSSAAANASSSPTATPPPVTAPCRTSSNPQFPAAESPSATCNPEDGETQIDTEQISLAKDANILYYLTYVPVECNNPAVSSCPQQPNGLGYAYQGLAEADDEIQQAIADNNGGSTGPDVLSLSYGGPEILNSFEVTNGANGYDPTTLFTAEFAALAVEGVAVFASSGDQGSITCAPYSISLENTPCVSYPGGDQNVTSVGGVFAPLNNAGQLVGAITAWGQQTASGGASGGGVSTIVPAPVWQTGPGVKSSGRNQPDVSLMGDPYSGVATVLNTPFGGTSHVSIYGGTSVAAPQMAAMWALVLDACRQTPACVAKGTGPKPYRLGNAAPYFYKIYNNATLYPQTFYDVTFGNNALVGCSLNGSCPPGPKPTPAPGYTAGTGYDLVTGIGVPFARHLITAVVGV